MNVHWAPVLQRDERVRQRSGHRLDSLATYRADDFVGLCIQPLVDIDNDWRIVCVGLLEHFQLAVQQAWRT